MNYIILGIVAKREQNGRFDVSVAWTNENMGDSWRVTSDQIEHLPTDADFIMIARQGWSLSRSEAAKRFPYLPAKHVCD